MQQLKNSFLQCQMTQGRQKKNTSEVKHYKGCSTYVTNKNNKLSLLITLFLFCKWSKWAEYFIGSSLNLMYKAEI